MPTRRSFFVAMISATALLGLVTGASAQSAIEARLEAGAKKLQAACGDDLKKYCGQVTPGEGRLTLCVMAHEDKISSKCDLALYEASRNLQRALDRIEMAADACWADIEKNCADIKEGGGRIAQCLVSKKSSLSKGCQAVVSKFPAK